MSEDNRLRELVAQVAGAYFSHAHVNTSDIPGIVQQIASSLGAITASPRVEEAEPQSETSQTPTRAQVRKSIRSDALISFEDGKAYKILKPHLKRRGLTVEQYRQKWGLPKDYPAVASDYSARRASFARARGLGKKPAVSETPEPATPPKPASKPARRQKSAAPVVAGPAQTNEADVQS